MKKTLRARTLWLVLPSALGVAVGVASLFFASSAYRLLFLLPLSYAVFHAALFFFGGESFTVRAADGCAALRYVVLPLFYLFSPVYTFASYTARFSDKLDPAILYMVYELCVVGAFFCLWHLLVGRRRAPAPAPRGAAPMGGVLLFPLGVLCAALMILAPEAWENVGVLFLTGGRDRVNGAANSTVENVALQAMLLFLLIGFVWVACRLARSGRRWSLPVTLALAVLSGTVIVSEQRALIVYAAAGSLALLSLIYPDRRRVIFRTVGIVFAAVLLLLTVYKSFYVFHYGSYGEAISAGGGISAAKISYVCETYLIGPETVAASMDYIALGRAPLGQFFYDLARPFVGISFLVKNCGYTLTSEAFNFFVTGGKETVGYFLPIGLQGALTFGYAAGPLLLVLTLLLALALERRMRATAHPLLRYFCAYVWIRTATAAVDANTATVLGVLSTALVPALLYAGADALCRRLFLRLRKGGGK